MNNISDNLAEGGGVYFLRDPLIDSTKLCRVADLGPILMSK
jgi:hypothetical protein